MRKIKGEEEEDGRKTGRRRRGSEKTTPSLTCSLFLSLSPPSLLILSPT
jgi:hypothetical protein